MAIANGTCVSFCTFWPPCVAPGTIAVNVTWMERGFNAGQTHRIGACTHLPSTVYEILVGNCNFSLLPLHLTLPLEFREKVWTSEN